jgi:uncharacterized protein
MSEASPSSVEAELRHASESLQAAEALLALDLNADAASRIYYAVFHAARALLHSVGVAPRSHEATRSLLALHFVRSGKLNPERSKDIAQLEALRSSGDYDPHFALGREHLAPELARARRFVEEAQALLEQS